MSRNWLVALGLVTLLALGCGRSGKATVSGTITCEGQPVVRARITVRSNATGDWATAVTNDRGRFELGTEESGDGVPAGDYYVVIAEDRGDWDSPRPRMVDPKYEQPSTSGITLKVAAGEKVTLDLALDPA